MKHIKDMKNVNMKKLFRRNQIIVTTLAIMIAAAGYLNYTGKKELAAGGNVYEAGVMEISDEDLLAENQKILGEPGNLQEIPSLDQDLAQIEEAESAASGETPAVGTNLASAETLAADTNLTSGETLAAGEILAAGEVSGMEAVGGEESGVPTGLENPGEAVLTSGMSVTDYIAGVQLSREQIRAKNKETLLNIINSSNIEEAAKQEAIQNMISLTAVAEKENAAETLLMAKGFSDPVVSVTSGKVDVVVNAASITDPQRAQIEDIVKRKTEVGAENIIITLLNLEE
ncbi:MAG: SpoIIIAH-like family protein [Hungatella sp.]